jgi:hypothetical protein
LSSFSALRCEPVNIWRLIILAAETGDICVTQIIGHDEDNIRFSRTLSCPRIDHVERGKQ